MTREEFLQFIEQTFADMLQLIKDKNADYSGDSINPFANFSAIEALGACSTEVGIIVRMTDKFRRVISLVTQGNARVQSESIQDILKDLANYSIILAAYLHSKEPKNDGPIPPIETTDPTESPVQPGEVV